MLFAITSDPSDQNDVVQRPRISTFYEKQHHKLISDVKTN